jgi:hypothetical protein
VSPEESEGPPRTACEGTVESRSNATVAQWRAHYRTQALAGLVRHGAEPSRSRRGNSSGVAQLRSYWITISPHG